MTETLRVMICDDIQPIAKKIAMVLNRTEAIELVGIAQSGKEALDMAVEEKPNVILMDIEMETKQAGIIATKQILKKLPNVKIVMLTVHESCNYIFEAFGVGAVDYLLKNSSPEEIVASIRSAVNNNSSIDPSVFNKLRDELYHRQQSHDSLLYVLNLLFRLSHSEMEVLELFLMGKTRREVNDMRVVEMSTTKSQIRSILYKTETSSIGELVDLITDLGLEQFISKTLSRKRTI